MYFLERMIVCISALILFKYLHFDLIVCLQRIMGSAFEDCPDFAVKSSMYPCVTCACVWLHWRACHPSSWWWSCHNEDPGIPPPSSETTAAVSPWPSCHPTGHWPECQRSAGERGKERWISSSISQGLFLILVKSASYLRVICSLLSLISFRFEVVLGSRTI